MFNTIKAEEYYNALEIWENRFFRWAKSYTSVKNWIERDRAGDNVLQSQKYGEGTGLRYLIKGENIIKFIAMFDDGSLTLGNIQKE